MMFARELLIGFLDFIRVGASRHPEYLVVIFLSRRRHNSLIGLARLSSARDPEYLAHTTNGADFVRTNFSPIHLLADELTFYRPRRRIRHPQRYLWAPAGLRLSHQHSDLADRPRSDQAFAFCTSLPPACGLPLSTYRLLN